MERKVIDVAQEMFPEISAGDKVSRYGWAPMPPNPFSGMETVALGELVIDYSYQRNGISQQVIRDICSDFDPLLFDPIVVNKRTMCVLDGQHRAIVMARRGDTGGVIGVRYIDIPKQDEARYFLTYNRRINSVSAIDQHKDRVAMRDEIALFVEDCAASIGKRIINHSGAGNIAFVAELNRAARISRESTRKAIVFCASCCSNEAILKQFFCGAFYLINNNIPLGDSERDKILLAGGQFSVICEIRRILIETNSGFGSNIKIGGRAILNIINKGRRKKIAMPGL